MWQKIQSRNPVVVPANVNAMENALKSIHSRIIHLDSNERKEYSKRLGDIVLEKLTNEMKKDEAFKALFKKISFSGSYYENLRVKSPNEFDLNLLFQLPKEFQPVKIVTDNVKPGFARLKLTNTPPPPGTKVQQKVMKFLDAGNFILRDKVLSWLQGVVDTALRGIDWQMELLDPSCTVRRSRSGPAITLNVTHGINRREFSVDLVPVFSFTKEHWPGRPIRQLTPNMDSKDLEWFIVPKGPRSGDPSGQQWRMSFYMHERKIMGNNQNMKPTAKFLKLLRDTEDWKGLSSYYIKTVFLWEMTCQEGTGLFWRKSMSYLFYHMLCVLENCLASNYIPFFWHEKCNLLEHISTSTTTIWAYRIARIRKDIDRKLANPEDLGRYINSIVQRENQGQLGRANAKENVVPTENIRGDQTFVQRLRQQQYQHQQQHQQQQQQQEEQQGNAALAFGITLGIAAVALAGGITAWFASERNRRQQ